MSESTPSSPETPTDKRLRIPEWLIGMIAALIIVTLVLWLGGELGFGDNPVLD